jgi:hypothetical protein
MAFPLNPNWRIAAVALAIAASPIPALADTPCKICATAVVTNAELAKCFLSSYDDLSRREGAAVVVDLSECERDRGVVEALPLPSGPVAEPDLSFILSRPQLDCLKRKLEEPGLALDPAATIPLDRC